MTESRECLQWLALGMGLGSPTMLARLLAVCQGRDFDGTARQLFGVMSRGREETRKLFQDWGLSVGDGSVAEAVLEAVHADGLRRSQRSLQWQMAQAAKTMKPEAWRAFVQEKLDEMDREASRPPVAGKVVADAK